MANCGLDGLLSRLDVRVEPVAVCEIAQGATLAFEPMAMIVIHHVVRGHGILDTARSPPAAFGPGAMIVIPSGCSKRITAGSVSSVVVQAQDHCSHDAGKLMRITAADSGRSDLAIVCGAVRARCGSFGPFDALQAPLVEDMSDVPAIRLAFQAMLAEQINPELLTTALTQALMKQCLLLFIRRHIANQPASPLSATLCDERLAKALNSILEHPRELLSIRLLSAAAGMSRSGFAKLFAQALRMTPMDFVRQTRLQRAAELLNATDLPIKTIAGEVGYASRSQFCRAFRAAFDVHPTAYRRRCRGDHSATAGRIRTSSHSAAPISAKAEPLTNVGSQPR